MAVFHVDEIQFMNRIHKIFFKNIFTYFLFLTFYTILKDFFIDDTYKGIYVFSLATAASALVLVFGYFYLANSIAVENRIRLDFHLW